MASGSTATCFSEPASPPPVPARTTARSGCPAPGVSHLDADGAQLTNSGTGSAFHGDGLAVDRDLFLRAGFTATSASPDSTIRLPGAQLSHLGASTAQITNSGTGPALLGDGLAIAARCC